MSTLHLVQRGYQTCIASHENRCNVPFMSRRCAMAFLLLMTDMSCISYFGAQLEMLSTGYLLFGEALFYVGQWYTGLPGDPACQKSIQGDEVPTIPTTRRNCIYTEKTHMDIIHWKFPRFRHCQTFESSLYPWCFHTRLATILVYKSCILFMV